MPHLLTKSDFKVAQTCPTKLYYKKLEYPSTLDSNKLMRLLAEGGYVVEEIARLMYPGGVDIDYAGGHDGAAEQTAVAMQQENVTIYEATFIHGSKLIRVDILNKIGNRIDIIEVKAKSWDTNKNIQRLRDDKPSVFRQVKNPDKIMSEWRKYIEDVAFQYALVRDLYPDAEIGSYLMMPDKSKSTSIDVLYQNFDLVEHVNPHNGRSSYEVSFTGDAEQLRNHNPLALVNVQAEVELILPELLERAATYLASLNPELVKLPQSVSPSCAKCEYRVEDDRSGFNECWAAYGTPDHHVLDLYHAGNSRNVRKVIADGGANLFDLHEADLRKPDGTHSSTTARQEIQLRHTRSGTEWRGESLEEIVRSATYPLHFIDFETSGLAVPYYANMRPYENVAFQWSCHTLREPGGELEHSEWLNNFHDFPSFEFASTLRDQIGNDGTVLAWAPHEKHILQTILKQMKSRKYYDSILEMWIKDLVVKNGRLLDMHKICLAHYFHPVMKGKTSIKNVVDAVWRSNASIRSGFPEYDTGADITSPYNSLPSVSINGRDETIAEGTGAMIAYGKMLYGSGTEEDRATWRQLLLQYCKLDTAAMVMIWYHWGGR